MGLRGREEREDPARKAEWLSSTRRSYDTVAEPYADLLATYLDDDPHDRAQLALLADLVHRSGGGPVLDVGCGPGHLTAHLSGLGLDVGGVDLSAGMVVRARRDHPGLRFEVASMTDLAVRESSLAAVLAWYSLIHVPDDDVVAVLARFHRALRPGGVLLIGFHVGERVNVKTQGYGGLPMHVRVHLRTVGDAHRLAGGRRLRRRGRHAARPVRRGAAGPPARPAPVTRRRPGRTGWPVR